MHFVDQEEQLKLSYSFKVCKANWSQGRIDR
jgi:hypothetical protein